MLQRGVASATAAAAIYYEERRAQLSCLWYLLQSQALLDSDSLEEVQQQVFQYTTAFLREQQNGKRKIFSHLLQLIQVPNPFLRYGICSHVCQSEYAVVTYIKPPWTCERQDSTPLGELCCVGLPACGTHP